MCTRLRESRKKRNSSYLSVIWTRYDNRVTCTIIIVSMPLSSTIIVISYHQCKRKKRINYNCVCASKIESKRSTAADDWGEVRSGSATGFYFYYDVIESLYFYTPVTAFLGLFFPCYRRNMYVIKVIVYGDANTESLLPHPRICANGLRSTLNCQLRTQ